MTGEFGVHITEFVVVTTDAGVFIAYIAVLMRVAVHHNFRAARLGVFQCGFEIRCFCQGHRQRNTTVVYSLTMYIVNKS